MTRRLFKVKRTHQAGVQSVISVNVTRNILSKLRHFLCWCFEWRRCWISQQIPSKDKLPVFKAAVENVSIHSSKSSRGYTTFYLEGKVERIWEYDSHSEMFWVRSEMNNGNSGYRSRTDGSPLCLYDMWIDGETHLLWQFSRQNVWKNALWWQWET